MGEKERVRGWFERDRDIRQMEGDENEQEIKGEIHFVGWEKEKYISGKEGRDERERERDKQQ